MALETAVRVRLASGERSIPLKSLYAVSAFASLTGSGEDYFLGWLAFHGEEVPVFDLNRVVCEEPTVARYGSRVLIAGAGAGAPTRLIGLLADGAIDTVSEADMPLLDLRPYVSMLATLTPAVISK